ncbi:MAG: hypothetical protein JNM56_29390 [Planctomycetia bacterium]|nr:hypothetical protein [Planctomycetia bacterium]
MSRLVYLPLGVLVALSLGGLYFLKDRLGGPPQPTAQAQAPLISRYAPPTPAEITPTSERQPAEVIPANEPPRLLSAAEQEPRPVEVKLEPPQPTLPASRIVLTGGEDNPTPPPAPEPTVPIPPPPAPEPAPPVPPPVAPVPMPAPAAPMPAPPTYAPPPPPVYNPQPPVAVFPPQNPAPLPMVVGCPWILKMEIVEGRSKIEARTENGIQLKVACDRLSVRSPDGDIEATGNVAFSSTSLEGSCERLTLSWRDSQISLNGKVRLKGKQEEHEVDLAGDQLSFKLAPSGRVRKDATSSAPPAAAPSRSEVIPAGGIMPAPSPAPRPEPMTPRPEPVPPNGPLSAPPLGTPPPPDNSNGLVPGTTQNLPRPSSDPVPGVRESRTPGSSSQTPSVTESRNHNVVPQPQPAVSESRTPSVAPPSAPFRPTYVSR